MSSMGDTITVSQRQTKARLEEAKGTHTDEENHIEKEVLRK